MRVSATIIDDRVYLTKTDTIIGFISQNKGKLDKIKIRSDEKHYIIALPSLRALKTHTRIASKHKNIVRRSSRTTFIMPNGLAYRVVADRTHNGLIKYLGWAYTTSANRSGEEYNEKWARGVADITIEPLNVSNLSASKIYILGVNRLRRIR